MARLLEQAPAALAGAGAEASWAMAEEVLQELAEPAGGENKKKAAQQAKAPWRSGEGNASKNRAA